jgi:hypothetical protein
LISIVCDVANEITDSKERIDFWNGIANRMYNLLGFDASEASMKEFNSIEDRNHFKNGLINSLDLNNITDNLAVHLLKDITLEMHPTSQILIIYAINKILFANINNEEIMKFNHRLNIQWVLDVKNAIGEN